MKFLENHPKIKLFIQCALSIGYFIFMIIQCSHTIDHNLLHPTPFIEAVTTTLNLSNIANAIGLLYFIGGSIGFILGVIILQAIINVCKDIKSIKTLSEE